METNLVLEGTKFMFLGMGTVFVFLFIMIVATNIVSKVINRFFPEPVSIPKTETHEAHTQSAQDNKKIVAAITAAIMHHRRQG
ncbi:OadG family transporter subunit [Sulfurimonas sp. HSL-1716]|uniref:OadG family protein n=1 Tax=Hydrocurvibacter sulfurireducens TaxID=3131937 RepID=UPI0031F78CBE